MTETAASRAKAFLLRAVLMAGTLAIIAGLFAMHVMTGSHSMHAVTAPAAAGETAHSGPARADSHTGHSAVYPDAATAPATATATGQNSGKSVPPSCSCSGPCTAVPAMAASCVPSQGNANLAAPPPGTTPFAIDFKVLGSSAFTGAYSYLPASRSPGELSISRT